MEKKQKDEKMEKEGLVLSWMAEIKIRSNIVAELINNLVKGALNN
jgi:hypothetical protein